MSDGSLTFAVMADGHIRPAEDEAFGDYPSSRLANDRNRVVIELINQLAPDLVFHLGDFVHPIPILRAYGPAVRTARDILNGLDRDLHVVAGNHDVGDKISAWVPAPPVDETGLALFQQAWGPNFTSFDQGGCHFVIINSPLLNSGLQLEAEQRAWLEADLAASREQGGRIFLFSHYPLFLTEPDEPEHYDNIGRPARDWLLSLLDQFRVEAVFSGHVHNFFYNRYHDTDLYVLPSVAFVRPGYSELFDVAPAAEFGRDDRAKLGFAQVTVHQRGHQVRLIRTYGASNVSEAIAQARTGRSSHSPLGNQPVPVAPIGVFLRQDWAAPRLSSFSNLDEFGRKRIRNDYLLWALWELGIRDHRIPLNDLAQEETRRRIRLLQRHGHAFTAFSAGPPDQRTAELLAQFGELIRAWEVIVPWEQMGMAIATIGEIKNKVPVSTLLSRLDTLTDQPDWELTDEFDHFPRAGFLLSEQRLMAACLDDMGAAALIDGFVLRLEPEATPWEGVRAAESIAGRFQKIAALHVGLPRATEGTLFDDDVSIANRVAEALAAAAACKPRRPGTNVRVFLDTFADHDRGYYPRHGLVDRRYNPRPAYHVLGQLATRLPGSGGLQMMLLVASEGIRSFSLSGENLHAILLLSTGDAVVGEEIKLNWAPKAIRSKGLARWLDLSTGQLLDVNWRRIGAGDLIAVRLPQAGGRFYPALISLQHAP